MSPLILTTPRRAAIVALLVVAVGALAACAPAAERSFGPPTFRIVPEASGLVRFDPPGIGAGGAVFRLVLEVQNPNPVAVRLASLETDVAVGGVPIGSTSLPGGLELPGRGASRVTLEVAVPAERVPALAGVLVDVVTGRTVTYRVDGVVGIDVLGSVQRFPRVTLVQGSFAQDLALRAPDVSIDRGATGVRSVAFDQITLDVGFRVRNPNPVGVIVRAPEARLRLGDRDVALIQLVPEPIPALSETTLVQRVVVNPVALGAALVRQLQILVAGGRASVELAVVGAWELEVPGIQTFRLDPEEIVRGRLD
jgi:LEA14-like dessication related protein